MEEHVASGERKFNRKVTNFLLQPSLQTKLGFYCILLSLAFAIALG